MRRFAAFAVLALGLGFTALPVANAQDLELRIDRDGPSMRLLDDCNPRRENCRGDRRGWERRQCSPERALNKAERMGLYRVRIRDIGRRTIKVRGRNRDGDRVTIVFSRRDRRCPVIDRFVGF